MNGIRRNRNLIKELLTHLSACFWLSANLPFVTCDCLMWRLEKRWGRGMRRWQPVTLTSKGLEGRSIYRVLLATTKGRLPVPISPDCAGPEQLQGQCVSQSLQHGFQAGTCLVLHLSMLMSGEVRNTRQPGGQQRQGQAHLWGIAHTLAGKQMMRTAKKKGPTLLSRHRWLSGRRGHSWCRLQGKNFTWHPGRICFTWLPLWPPFWWVWLN